MGDVVYLHKKRIKKPETNTLNYWELLKEKIQLLKDKLEKQRQQKNQELIEKLRLKP